MIKRIIYSGIFVVVFCIIFNHYLSGNAVLMTTDASIKTANVAARDVIAQMTPNWNSARLLGLPRWSGTQTPGLLKIFFNGIVWNNTIYALACLFASFAFMRFFRKMAPWAAVMGGLAAFWLGSNFTLLYPGHNFKSYVVLFFVCSLIPTAKAATGSIRHALVWGGCVGLMFAQQPDVALFFALFSGTYLVFLLWKQQGFKPLHWLKVLLPAVIVALLFAVGPLLSGYEHNVKGTAQMEKGDPQEKWNYVTQWSLPVEDTVDFMAPGYHGIRSQDPTGPYWGRMGRSAGWEETKQGFQNFKLESTYIGMIPILFAVYALFAARRSKFRAEILFWAGAALVSLLLSFGKYFPLYSLFYKLPVVNNIRNPNKFIQVFQICLAILSVYGLDALWRSKEDGRDADAADAKNIRAFFWTSLGVLAWLGIWALIAQLGQQSGMQPLIEEGWTSKAAQTIVQVKAIALWHAVFMSALVVAVFALFSFPKLVPLSRYRNSIAALLVLVVGVDAVKLSKNYVQEMPRSFIERNSLTDFLKSNLGDQRVAFLSQQGIFNNWLTYLMPYNGIPTFNVEQMPRTANDYKAFLTAGQRNPIAMWRFSAVKYLVAPTAAAKQLVPAGCRKAYSFSLGDGGEGNYRIVPALDGQISVFELQGALPRYALMAGSAKVPDQSALDRLADLDTVLLPEDSSLPVLSGSGQTGAVETISRKPGHIRLKISTDAPAILRIAEKYDPDWQATIDGKKVSVERVDYLCQGVSIVPGEHEVILRYAPSKRYFLVQCLGFALLLGGLVSIVIDQRSGHAEG